MTQFARHFLLALQFFTRIPVTGRLADWVGFSPAMLRASAAHFPGVGWIVGGLTAVVLWGLLLLLPAVPATGPSIGFAQAAQAAIDAVPCNAATSRPRARPWAKRCASPKKASRRA